MVGLVLVVVLASVAPARAQGTDLAPGDIVVVDAFAFGLPSAAGGVIRVDPETGVQTEVSSGGFFSNPTGIALEADGNILIGDWGDFPGVIIRVDPATGAQTIVSAGGFLVTPIGIAVEADGSLLVSDASARAVIRIDPVTGVQTIVSSGGTFQPLGIALEADGNILVADGGFLSGGSVIRVDPVTGAQTTVSSGPFWSPFGLAVDANGSIVVAYRAAADFNITGAVVRVDPQTGLQTPISIEGFLEAPAGVAIDANGQILVADPTAFGGGGGVIRIDPETGFQTIVSSGGSFVDPIGIAVVPAVPSGVEDALGALRTLLSDLVARGALRMPWSQPMEAALRGFERALARGDHAQAEGKLQLFERHVEALAVKGRLQHADARALLAAAQAVRMGT